MENPLMATDAFGECLRRSRSRPRMPPANQVAQAVPSQPLSYNMASDQASVAGIATDAIGKYIIGFGKSLNRRAIFREIPLVPSRHHQETVSAADALLSLKRPIIS